MKLENKYIIAIAVVLALMIAGLVYQDNKIKSLSRDRDKYKNNTESLMMDVEMYKVRDSLNAARSESLELTIKEYERFREADAALIRDLKSKNRDLKDVVTTQSETIIALSAIPRDTVIIRDSVKMDAIALHCGDEWYDFDGILTEKDFTGNMVARDSLLVAETVKYKRFLGFLWKTKKIQNRMVDVISKNPHTLIQDCELITIEK